MKRLTAIILLFAMVITFSPMQALAEEGGIGGAVAAGEPLDTTENGGSAEDEKSPPDDNSDESGSGDDEKLDSDDETGVGDDNKTEGDSEEINPEDDAETPEDDEDAEKDQNKIEKGKWPFPAETEEGIKILTPEEAEAIEENEPAEIPELPNLAEEEYAALLESERLAQEEIAAGLPGETDAFLYKERVGKAVTEYNAGVGFVVIGDFELDTKTSLKPISPIYPGKEKEIKTTISDDEFLTLLNLSDKQGKELSAGERSLIRKVFDMPDVFTGEEISVQTAVNEAVDLSARGFSDAEIATSVKNGTADDKIAAFDENAELEAEETADADLAELRETLENSGATEAEIEETLELAEAAAAATGTSVGSLGYAGAAGVSSYVGAPVSGYSGTSEFIDTFDGKLVITLPTAHLPGTAGLDLDLSLRYDSNRAAFYGQTGKITCKDHQDKVATASLSYKATTQNYNGRIIDKMFYPHQDNLRFSKEFKAEAENFDIIPYVSGLGTNTITAYDYYTIYSSQVCPVCHSSLTGVNNALPISEFDKAMSAGTGWFFNFTYVARSPLGGIKTLYLADGRRFELAEDTSGNIYFKDYLLDDVKISYGQFVQFSNQIGYLVSYVDGKKEFLTPDGNIRKIIDRFDNTISFDYVNINNNPGIKITDSCGREINIYNETTANGIDIKVALPDNGMLTYSLTKRTDLEIPAYTYIEQVAGSDIESYIEYASYGYPSQKGEYILSSFTDAAGVVMNFEYDIKDSKFNINGKRDGLSSDFALNKYAALKKITFASGFTSEYRYGTRTVDYLTPGTMQRFQVVERKNIENGIAKERYQYGYGNDNYNMTYRHYPDMSENSDCIRKNLFYEATYAEISNGLFMREFDLYGSAKTEVATGKKTSYIINPQGFITDFKVEANNKLSETGSFTYPRISNVMLPLPLTKTSEIYDSNGQYAHGGAYERNEYTFTGQISRHWAMGAPAPQYDEDGNLLSMPQLPSTSYTYDSRYGYPTYVMQEHSGTVEQYTYTQLSQDGKTSASKTEYEHKLLSNGNAYAPYDMLRGNESYAFSDKGQLLSKTENIYVDYGSKQNIYHDGELFEAPIIDYYTAFTTAYEYYQNGMLKKQDAGAGDSDIYTYDDIGRILSVNSGGNTTSYTYNAGGRITSVTAPDGAETAIEYDYVNNAQVITAPEGASGTRAKVKYEFNSFGEVVTETDITDPGSPVILATNEYDNIGRKVKEYNNQTENSGGYIAYTYDEQGRRLTKKIHSKNGTMIYNEGTGYSSDSSGSMYATYVYSGNSGQPNLANVEHYDRFGRIYYHNNGRAGYNIVTDKWGNITAGYGSFIEYDNIYEEESSEYTYSDSGYTGDKSYYDSRGNMVCNIKNGVKTIYEYDHKNRLIKEEIPATGIFKTNAYDSKGNLTEQNANGTVTRYTYDSCGRALSVITDATGTPYYTQYAYDKLGNVIKCYTGQAGLLTLEEDGSVSAGTPDVVLSYTYDRAGRLLSETDGMGAVESYVYDKNGFMLQKTKKSGIKEIYTYTPMGQMLTYSVCATGSQYVNKIESYTYYQNGLLRSTTQNGGPYPREYMYAYNADGSIAQEIEPLADYCQGAAKKTYGYDNLGQVTRIDMGILDPLSQNYETRYSVGYAYSGNNLKAVYDYVQNITQPVRTYTYDSSDRLLKDGSIKYEYNGNGQITAEKDTLQNKTLATYQYNDKGQLQSKTNSFGTVTVNESYTYDGQGRLLTAGSESYTYDRRGNRLSKAKNGVTTSYAYDKGNKLLTETTGGSVTSYGYDGDGNNITVTGGITRRYNAKNQMVYEKAPGYKNGWAEYGYHPSGLRATKFEGEMVDVVPWNDIINYYIWAGDKLISETDGVQERCLEKPLLPGGQRCPNPYEYTYLTENTNYIYGNGLVSQYKLGYELWWGEVRSNDMMSYHIDYMLLVGKTTEKKLNVTTNAMGDVSMLTEAYSYATKALDYSAFGDSVTVTGTTGTGGANISTPFGYRGEYKDSETGNIYLRARYYSPGLGRFTTSDPAKADGYNWYSYCGGDPVNKIDPSGREAITVTAGLGAAAIAAAKAAGIVISVATIIAGVEELVKYIEENKPIFYAVNGHSFSKMKQISPLNALIRVFRGQNVYTPGRIVAKSLAAVASFGKSPVHDSLNYNSHYHLHGRRNGAHIFYGIVK